jgi:hypothetical protein
MVELADIQAAYYMVAATGVLVAAIFYVLNMKATLQTRQAQLFMQIHDKISTPEFLENLFESLNLNLTVEEYNEKFGLTKNPKDNAKFSSVGSTLEGIGVLVKRGLIDTSMVDDLMSWMVISFYEKYQPFIMKDRKVNPASGEWLEYLYDRVKEIRNKQHPTSKVL